VLISGQYDLICQRVNNPCNAISLSCGTIQAGSINSVAEINPYTLSLVSGSTISIQLAGTSSFFTPQIELYSPNGFLITLGNNITAVVTNTGVFTVMVDADGSTNSQTGEYDLSLQLADSPCNPVSIELGQTYSGVISSPAEIDAYTFNAGIGGVTLCLATESTNLAPIMELYDTNGTLLASSSSQIQQYLGAGGTFNVLVRDANGTGAGDYELNLQSGLVNCSSIDLQDPVVDLTSPGEGDFILRGTNYAIQWSVTDSNSTIVSQDILLSSDGGATYPSTIAANLPGSVRTYDWAVPSGVSSTAWSVRVIAQDAAGHLGQDDSDGMFLVVSPADLGNSTYDYDALGELVQGTLADGSSFAYGYDATGNRVSTVTAAGTSGSSGTSGTIQPFQINAGSTNLQLTANGFLFQVSGLNESGPVVIYASTNLLDWMPIFTNPAFVGTILFVDPNTTNLPWRFYRATEQ
jgi:YD repeat-containing protein